MNWRERPERLRRVLLFMPGDSLPKIEKGIALGVDSLIMDLEDGVAVNRKADARQTIAHALTTLHFGRSEPLVRVNPVGSGLESDDLAAVLPAHPAGIVLPKVESAEQVRWLSAQIAAQERESGWPAGEIRLLAIVETALGVVNLREIATSDPRLESLIFGAEDLAGSLGAVRTAAGWEVFYGRSAVVTHAAAYGLGAVDTLFTDFTDEAGLLADAKLSVQMGFTGKLAIHPKQIGPILAAFTPSAAELEAAEALIAAYEAHQAAGRGAFAYGGRMVDMPMIRAARRVLSRRP
jgi:citrate lyase beta subunit